MIKVIGHVGEQLDKLITHQDGMSQVPQAREQQCTGNAGKVVPDPWTSSSYQTVTRDALSMDVHEVTVGLFKKFVELSGYNYRPFAINRWNNVVKYLPGDRSPMVEVD